MSHVIHVPMNRIACRVKRMGGGFGGKESRGMLVALPVALAAHKLQRPVRCMLDRDEDMMMTGTRHPFLIKYKVATTKEGRVMGAIVNIYNNGGYSIDLSGPVSTYICMHNLHSSFFTLLRFTFRTHCFNCLLILKPRKYPILFATVGIR